MELSESIYSMAKNWIVFLRCSCLILILILVLVQRSHVEMEQEKSKKEERYEAFRFHWLQCQVAFNNLLHSTLQFRSRFHPIIHRIVSPGIKCDSSIGNTVTLEAFLESLIYPFILHPQTQCN